MAEPLDKIISYSFEMISARYNPEKFVGREWLIEEVARFRDDEDRRHLLIIGEPGSGKSAFLAYLAELWNCPRHFIRVDNTTGVTGKSSHNLLVSLGEQLYQKYGPDIFERSISGTTQVTAILTKDKSEVVGRFIDEVYSIPFLPLQRDVRVQAGITAGESRVIGERVNRWIDITLALDALTLLHVMVINPLKKIQTLYPKERVVIFIDALDEPLGDIGEEHKGKRIVDIIPKAADADFPSNLRLVMTSRRGEHLIPFRSEDLLYLDDEAKGYRQASQKDIRAYIDRQLCETPLAEAQAAWSEEKVLSFIAEVQTNADNNFLYLYHFFNEIAASIQKGVTDPQSIPVPKDLDDIYRVFAVEKIKRHVLNSISFTATGDISAQLLSQWQDIKGVNQVDIIGNEVTMFVDNTGKVLEKVYPLAFTAGVGINNLVIEEGGKSGAWEEKYLPLLGVLAVAYEALSREQLAGFAGVVAIYVDSVIGQLQQFLDVEREEEENRYRLYHKSFGEYLLDSSRNREYPLDSSKYHYQIASYYRGEKTDWSEVNWMGIRDLYPFRYLALHLVGAAKREELYALINKNWMEVQKQHGMDQVFVRDVQLAIDTARSELPPNLMQEVRDCLIYATMGSFTTNLPPEAFGVLARLGYTQYAQSLALLLQDEPSRRRAYASIGKSLLKQGETEKATPMLLQALARAEVDELSVLTPALAQVGKLDRVLAAIDAFENDTLRAMILNDAALALTEDGQLERALSLVEAIGVKELQIKALRDMAVRLAQAGTLDSAALAAKQALSLAETITEKAVQGPALADVAEALAQAGELDSAGQIAKRALVLTVESTTEWRMMETVCMVAPVLAQIGELDLVLVAAEKIAEDAIRAIVQPSATQEMPQVEPQDASLGEELERASGIMTEVEDYVTQTMAQRLTCFDVVSQVPEPGEIILGKLTEDEIRTNALSWVAQTLSRAGKLARAAEAATALLAALERIPYQANHLQALAMSYISLILAQAGERVRAAEVADQVFEMLAVNPVDVNSSMYDLLLGGVIPAWALIGELEKAIDANNVMRGETEEETFFLKSEEKLYIYRKAEVLAEVAQHLIRAGNFEWSFAIAGAIKFPRIKTDVLLDFIRAITKVGVSDEVSMFLALIGESAYLTAGMGKDMQAIAEALPVWYRKRVLSSVAEALIELGRHERAEFLMSRVIEPGETLSEDSSDKAKALIDIAQALMLLGEREKAAQIAVRIVETIQGENRRSDIFPMSFNAAQVLAQLGEFNQALALLSTIGDESKNKAYALNDLAEAQARAGEYGPALATVEMLRDAKLKANALSRIALALAQAGEPDKAVEIAELARVTSEEPANRESGNASQERIRVSFLDEDIKEGSWMLSRVVQALTHADKMGNTAEESEWVKVLRLAEAVALFALIATGTLESEWVRVLRLGEALAMIQSGEKENAVTVLNQALAYTETIISDSYHKGRALRWIAQVLVLVGEFDQALSITQDLACLTYSGDIWGHTWKVNALRGITQALAEAGQRDKALQVANLALEAAEALAEGRDKSYELGRVFQILTQVGQHEQALTLWKAELAQAQLAGRLRVFNALGAGASAIAAIDHGHTLWAMYQEVIDVEDWWSISRLA